MLYFTRLDVSYYSEVMRCRTVHRNKIKTRKLEECTTHYLALLRAVEHTIWTLDLNHIILIRPCSKLMYPEKKKSFLF